MTTSIRVCVVSPHLDDAILWCGQQLSGWDRPTVATVFTEAPPIERTDGWNHRTTGAAWAPDTQAARRAEDAAALAVVGADRTGSVATRTSTASTTSPTTTATDHTAPSTSSPRDPTDPDQVPRPNLRVLRTTRCHDLINEYRNAA
jgi:LmbE family N-acetylglucosaminyl deacetylase